jgi:hypothetical protein
MKDVRSMKEVFFHWRYFRVGRCSEDVDVGEAVLRVVE